MSRVFSQEDGNLSTRPITTSRTVSYKDIDLTFSAKASGDIFKKEDGSAVKQAVKNLILTNFGEKPFQFHYGGNLNDFLFELNDVDDFEIQDAIGAMISAHEPRARLREVRVISRPDDYTVNVRIKFQVINVTEAQELNISLTRLR